MNCLESTAQKLTDISANLDGYVETSIKSSESLIIELNRANMMQGFNTDGSDIGGYALYIYEQMKSRMNPKAGGKVDLFLDGGYQGSMFVEVKSGIFKIKSSDSKYADLIDKYGDKHFGIPEKDTQLFSKIVMNELKKLIKL